MTNEIACYLQDVEDANLQDKPIFISLLRRGRAITNLTLRDLAKIAGTAPGTISRWENGYSAPPLVSRKAVIDFLYDLVQKI